MLLIVIIYIRHPKITLMYFNVTHLWNRATPDYTFQHPTFPTEILRRGRGEGPLGYSSWNFNKQFERVQRNPVWTNPRPSQIFHSEASVPQHHPYLTLAKCAGLVKRLTFLIYDGNIAPCCTELNCRIARDKPNFVCCSFLHIHQQSKGRLMNLSTVLVVRMMPLGNSPNT
jgi:hypothetical protein